MWNHKELLPDRPRELERTQRLVVVLPLLAAGLCLLLAPFKAVAEDTNGLAGAPTAGIDLTNLQDGLRAILDVQAQLKLNQTAIEQNGKEAREAAARSVALLSQGLQTIQTTVSEQQRALSEQNERELRVVQSSTRTLVTVGGIFAAVASLALLLVTYFQYRMSKVWAEITGGLPVLPSPGDSVGLRQLGSGAASGARGGSAEAGNLQLLRALERLESKVNDLERGSAAVPRAWSVEFPDGNGGQTSEQLQSISSGASERILTGEQARVSLLLQQGQSRSKQNDWEGALQCFDQVLELDPHQGEALVKKGAALEHLKKLSEAFQCYDQAIAADNSMTIAYLYKGGLCSRLERFKEALDCYEKALQTHDA